MHKFLPNIFAFLDRYDSQIFKNSNIYNLYSKCKQEITINKFDDDSDKKYQYIASGAEGSVWKYDTNKVVKLPQNPLG